MSVSQEPQFPRVVEWDSEEVLSYLADQYDSPAEREEDLGIADNDLVAAVSALEPDFEDRERREWFEELYEEMDGEYENMHRHDVVGMKDPENSDCYIFADLNRLSGYK